MWCGSMVESQHSLLGPASFASMLDLQPAWTVMAAHYITSLVESSMGCSTDNLVLQSLPHNGLAGCLGGICVF